MLDVVFLDFCEVFDTVPLDKMTNCGMSRFTVCRVKNQLNVRTQRAVVNRATSGR